MPGPFPDSRSMKVYYRPLVQTDQSRPNSARTIAGGWCWFDCAERLERGQPAKIIPASDIPADILRAIVQPRPPIAGLAMDRPRLMGVLNVTPDSFSDGGQFDQPDRAVAHGLDMVKAGADFIDIGGESTRPGATVVPASAEIARTQPVIEAIHEHSTVAISVDTRKAAVAAAALAAGACFVNDVSALAYDAELPEIIARSGAPLCLMHARGSPETMQEDPKYDDVLLDVYDYLSERISFADRCGISRDRITVDPGIGFGKSVTHNLALMRGLSLFHGLGCPILLATSRKRLIGTLAGEPDAQRRTPGSIALALAGITQGVQISRVHDIAEMRQALSVWLAATGMGQQA